MTQKKSEFVFGKKNFITLAAGFLTIIIGFILMSGGKAENPDEFHPEEIFSPIRITIAPAVVLIGFVIVGVGIMLKPSEDAEEINSAE